MMEQLTITNYVELQKELNAREMEVYNVLKLIQPATAWDILEYMEKANPNYVRPRLTDLLNKGLVEKRDQVKVNGILQWRWGVKHNI